MDVLFKQTARADDTDIQHLDKLVADTEKICEHLDRQKGIQRHRLWPGKGRVQHQQARTAALRYLDLLCHLRSVHCFCQLRHQHFHHSLELLAASPLADMQGLLAEALAPKTCCAPPITPDGKCKADEGDVDPLDEYMAQIDTAAKEAIRIAGSKSNRGEDSAVEGTASHKTHKTKQQEVPELQERHEAVDMPHRTAEAAAAEERVVKSAKMAAAEKAGIGGQMQGEASKLAASN